MSPTTFFSLFRSLSLRLKIHFLFSRAFSHEFIVSKSVVSNSANILRRMRGFFLNKLDVLFYVQAVVWVEEGREEDIGTLDGSRVAQEIGLLDIGFHAILLPLSFAGWLQGSLGRVGICLLRASDGAIRRGSVGPRGCKTKGLARQESKAHRRNEERTSRELQSNWHTPEQSQPADLRAGKVLGEISIRPSHQFVQITFPLLNLQPSSCLSDKEEDEIYGFGYGVFAPRVGRNVLQSVQCQMPQQNSLPNSSTNVPVTQHPQQQQQQQQRCPSHYLHEYESLRWLIFYFSLPVV